MLGCDLLCSRGNSKLNRYYCGSTEALDEAFTVEDVLAIGDFDNICIFNKILADGAALILLLVSLACLLRLFVIFREGNTSISRWYVSMHLCSKGKANVAIIHILSITLYMSLCIIVLFSTHLTVDVEALLSDEIDS